MFYKRFLLFAGHQYYPSAYWDDFVDSYETLDEAIEAYDGNWNDWGFIVDLETGAQRSLPDA